MLLSEYTTIWVHDFQTIKIILQEALQQLPVTIEHIGSTAVPGLAAKPIIDIDLVFANSVSFGEIKTRLERIGYCHNGNQGITDRDVFKRNDALPKHAVLDSIVHHLYVCPVHSEELKRHLLFRNYLRTNEETRNEYQQLKLSLAAEANQDRKQYAAIKEEKAKAFIDQVITNAALQGLL
ncbi:GrpB family protein [Lacibacter sediminis]|uniref:GrpB family protein n=1 Tax=Lacibacter sediminis TaxID=2760713 RepID=A0A7G5XIU0_9BACT|nr:GrpB family protein [Lacibacter sediminis]QNA45393.1 GrpB family protein [Lacibacter sediminis]